MSGDNGKTEGIIVKQKDMYQLLIIEFNNGKTVSANIPACFYSEEDIEGLSVNKIYVSKPMPLPDDVYFEKMDGIQQ